MEEVPEAVRGWCAAFRIRDMQTISATEAQAIVFGFRTLARHDLAARG
jgi:hypothetical protein